MATGFKTEGINLVFNDISNLGFKIITDGTATDIDRYMAISVFAFVFHEVTIIRIFRCCKLSTHRSQATTAVDATQHGTAIDIQSDITTNSTSCLSIATESTAATKHITIHV